MIDVLIIINYMLPDWIWFVKYSKAGIGPGKCLSLLFVEIIFGDSTLFSIIYNVLLITQNLFILIQNLNK